MTVATEEGGLDVSHKAYYWQFFDWRASKIYDIRIENYDTKPENIKRVSSHGKAHVMRLVLLIIGFPIWFSTFYVLKYLHTNS